MAPAVRGRQATAAAAIAVWIVAAGAAAAFSNPDAVNCTAPGLAVQFLDFSSESFQVNPALQLNGDATRPKSDNASILLTRSSWNTASVYTVDRLNLTCGPVVTAFLRTTVSECTSSCGDGLALVLQDRGADYLGGGAERLGVLPEAEPNDLVFIALALRTTKHALALYTPQHWAPDNPRWTFNLPPVEPLLPVDTRLWLLYNATSDTATIYYAIDTNVRPATPLATVTGVLLSLAANATATGLHAGMAAATSDATQTVQAWAATYAACASTDVVDGSCQLDCRAQAPGGPCLACPGGPGVIGTNCNTCAREHYGLACLPCYACAQGDCTPGRNGTCACHADWTGPLCSECTPGHYGPKCTPCTECLHGECVEGVDGACRCEANWAGDRCDACAAGHFGPDCTSCTACVHGTCIEGLAGECACEAAWAGALCDVCAAGHFGSTCLPCSDCQLGDCVEGLEGHCDCDAGANGTLCDVCRPDYFGAQCQYSCSLCPGDCHVGRQGYCQCWASNQAGDLCTECRKGYYGPRCLSAQVISIICIVSVAFLIMSGVAIWLVRRRQKAGEYEPLLPPQDSTASQDDNAAGRATSPGPGDAKSLPESPTGDV